MVPIVVFPPCTPSTNQVTPVFVELTTVARNCCVCFNVTGARLGEMLMPTTANIVEVVTNRKRNCRAQRHRMIKPRSIHTPLPLHHREYDVTSGYQDGLNEVSGRAESCQKPERRI